jgi:SOS-response transcriptional repressor LexA
MRDLGKRVGVSHVAISHAENNQTVPDKTTLIRLAQELQDDFGEPDLQQYLSAVKQLKIEAYVAAGDPIDQEIQGEWVSVDPETISIVGEVCALRVKGDSMIEHHILDSDVLICRKQPSLNTIPKDSIVVVDFRNARGAAIKRWRRKGTDRFVLSSDHYSDDYPKYEYPNSEIGKIYEVVGLVRTLR